MVVVLGGREEDKQVNVRWSVGDGCVGGGEGLVFPRWNRLCLHVSL